MKKIVLFIIIVFSVQLFSEDVPKPLIPEGTWIVYGFYEIELDSNYHNGDYLKPIGDENSDEIFKSLTFNADGTGSIVLNDETVIETFHNFEGFSGMFSNTIEHWNMYIQPKGYRSQYFSYVLNADSLIKP